MSRRKNPVAKQLADRKYHQRIVPKHHRTLDFAWLKEWDDIEGAELDVVEHFQRQGLIDAD